MLETRRLHLGGIAKSAGRIDRLEQVLELRHESGDRRHLREEP